MKDLSREEKIEQHISRLEKRILELKIDCRKNKWLRTKLTFFILSGVVYIIALEEHIINSMLGFLGWLIFAPLIAIGVMLISYLVLAYIINGVKEDMFTIGEMVGRLDAIKLSKYNEE